MSKKVSVLLSIYKVEEYLEECLDSILAQSYENLEIVCVDNGSPDGCGKILERYAAKDSRIKVVTLLKNRKLCGGRNAGLDNATGDFVCFVDPDDWIEKDYIKIMVEAIQTKKDSEGNLYNLVMNTSAVNYYISPQGNIEILFDYAREEQEISIYNINDNPRLETDMPMWGRLYRKSFLDKYNIRFLEGFNTDNIPYTMKLLAHMEKFYRLAPKPQAKYWRRMITPEGAITPVVLFKNFEIPKAIENMYDYLKEHGLSKKIRVFYHWFFTICFPGHQDQPEYYQYYKNLMIKMHDDIKDPSGPYQQCDRDLCNLLIYTSDFFQFEDLYFRMPDVKYLENYTFKLFNFLSVFKKKKKKNKIKYYIFGIPVLKKRYKNEETRYYLFSFIYFMTFRRKDI